MLLLYEWEDFRKPSDIGGLYGLWQILLEMSVPYPCVTSYAFQSV